MFVYLRALLSNIVRTFLLDDSLTSLIWSLDVIGRIHCINQMNAPHVHIFAYERPTSFLQKLKTGVKSALIEKTVSGLVNVIFLSPFARHSKDNLF